MLGVGREFCGMSRCGLGQGDDDHLAGFSRYLGDLAGDQAQFGLVDFSTAGMGGERDATADRSFWNSTFR